MYRSDRKWATVFLVSLTILTFSKAAVLGQALLPTTLFRTTGVSEVDDNSAKMGLALEAARVAAEAEMFELSFEAVKRVCAEGPPIAKPQIQSSLLGGQSSQLRSSAGRPVAEVPDFASQYGAKLFNIVDIWKAKQAPQEGIVDALEKIVFPTGRPNEIMLLNNAPTANRGSYSYEFSFAKPPTVRYLAFELIELAAKNKSLPRLIDKLEKLKTHPSSQTQAVAMLVYAHRVSGQMDAAAKVLESLVTKPVAVDHAMPLFTALSQTVPESAETSVLSTASTLPILSKFLEQNVTRMDIRGAILHQIKQVIQIGDQAAFDAYVAMVVESIHKMPGSDQNSINYMLDNFYRSLIEECKKQGKTAMATEVSARAVEVRTELGQTTVLEIDTMASFAELQPDARLKALRKMLIERPLVKLEQLSFAAYPQGQSVPEFFHLSSTAEKLKQFLPYRGAKSVSLLDLLLNQTEVESNQATLVKELLENANENNDVKRFLAIWINLRNEMRGKPVDTELSKLANFENEKEYIDWWKVLPVPAAIELLQARMRQGPLSTEFQAELQTRLNNQQSLHVFSEIRYQQRLAADKSLVNANRLKHWIVSYEPANFGDEHVPIWSIKDKKQIECFGGAWYGQLIFRYPVPANSTIQFSADRTEKKTEGLYCGGVTLVNLDDQQGICYAMAPNSRNLGQFAAAYANPTRAFEASFTDKALKMKIGSKVVDVLDFTASTVPFVGLASYGAKPSAYSEIAITSPSEIPREVPLLDAGLTGWNTGLSRHPLPKLNGHIETDGNVTAAPNEASGGPPMWTFVDNELRAGKSQSIDLETASAEEPEAQLYNPFGESGSNPATKSSFSCLNYSRPLCEGERFEYEFFHQSDTQNASPSIGRIAYIIREGKVTLRWISSNNSSDATNHEGEDPAAEVLAPVKLEPNAWNRVQMRIESGKIVMAVSGTDVYRRPVDKEEVLRFGFYCNPRKDKVRVRNVVLKGDWPTELPKDLWE